MDENDFEGTLVLEKLVKIGKVDDFLEAVDLETIATVLKKMHNADDA